MEGPGGQGYRDEAELAGDVDGGDHTVAGDVVGAGGTGGDGAEHERLPDVLLVDELHRQRRREAQLFGAPAALGRAEHLRRNGKRRDRLERRDGLVPTGGGVVDGHAVGSDLYGEGEADPLPGESCLHCRAQIVVGQRRRERARGV